MIDTARSIGMCLALAVSNACTSSEAAVDDAIAIEKAAVVPASATTASVEPPSALRVDAHDRHFQAERRHNRDVCPPIWYPTLDPMIQAGPLVDRLNTKLGGSPSHKITDVSEARPFVSLPNVRFVIAHDFSSACMMGHSHRACFASATRLYCDFSLDIEAFVRDFGLDENPQQLTDAQWVELVAALTDGATRVPSVFEAPICYWGIEPDVLRQVNTGVQREDGRWTVDLTYVNHVHELVRATLTIDADGVHPHSRILQRPDPNWGY